MLKGTLQWLHSIHKLCELEIVNATERITEFLVHKCIDFSKQLCTDLYYKCV